MKHKKICAIILAITTASTLMIGCGSNTNNTDKENNNVTINSKSEKTNDNKDLKNKKEIIFLENDDEIPEYEPIFLNTKEDVKTVDFNYNIGFHIDSKSLGLEPNTFQIRSGITSLKALSNVRYYKNIPTFFNISNFFLNSVQEQNIFQEPFIDNDKCAEFEEIREYWKNSESEIAKKSTISYNEIQEIYNARLERNEEIPSTIDFLENLDKNELLENTGIKNKKDLEIFENLRYGFRTHEKTSFDSNDNVIRDEKGNNVMEPSYKFHTVVGELKNPDDKDGNKKMLTDMANNIIDKKFDGKVASSCIATKDKYFTILLVTTYTNTAIANEDEYNYGSDLLVLPMSEIGNKFFDIVETVLSLESSPASEANEWDSNVF